MLGRIKYHNITKSWGNKKKCRDFAIRIDKWLSQFQKDEKPLMFRLLKNYIYYTEKSLDKKVVELYNKFMQEGEDDFIIAKIQKEFGANYSDFFYNIFWIRNSIKKRSEKNIFDLVNGADELPGTIVVVDDYSGSGKSFIRFYEKLVAINPSCKNVKIYFLTIQSSSVALEKIGEYATKNDYQIKCITLRVQERAFLDNAVYDSIKIIESRKQYKDVCNRFAVPEDYIFGFKQVEALVSFEYNTPNNTLGIFWYNLLEFSSLFYRNNEADTVLQRMQRDATKRKEIRKMKPAIQNIEDSQFNIFLAYCEANVKQFSIVKACEDLGLTAGQVNERLYRGVDEGYIDIKEGYIQPTEKLREISFSSRMSEFKKLFMVEECADSEKEISSDTYIPQNFLLNKKRR